MKCMSKNDLPSLHGLRALATIGIFLFHAGFVPYGTFPVTLFFMLSGFLMYYTKHSSNSLSSFRIWMTTYVYRKWKDFFPLHLLTFVIACIVGNVFQKPLHESIPSGILNLLLIHPFFEQYALSYNGLCWFLAVTLFLYVISYFLFKGIAIIRSTTAHMIVTLLTIIALNLMTRFGIPLYLYTNPIYRILDFWLGMLIAKIYTEKEHQLLTGTVIEVILVIVFLAQYLLSLLIGITPGYYSVLFAIAIYVFAAGKGVVSKILSADILRKISFYSFEFYMVHELALRVFRKVFPEISTPYLVRCTVIAIPSLIISIALAVTYKKISMAAKKSIILRSTAERVCDSSTSK